MCFFVRFFNWLFGISSDSMKSEYTKTLESVQKEMEEQKRIKELHRQKLEELYREELHRQKLEELHREEQKNKILVLNKEYPIGEYFTYAEGNSVYTWEYYLKAYGKGDPDLALDIIKFELRNNITSITLPSKLANSRINNGSNYSMPKNLSDRVCTNEKKCPFLGNIITSSKLCHDKCKLTYIGYLYENENFSVVHGFNLSDFHYSRSDYPVLRRSYNSGAWGGYGCQDDSRNDTKFTECKLYIRFNIFACLVDQNISLDDLEKLVCKIGEEDALASFKKQVIFNTFFKERKIPPTPKPPISSPKIKCSECKFNHIYTSSTNPQFDPGSSSTYCSFDEHLPEHLNSNIQCSKVINEKFKNTQVYRKYINTLERCEKDAEEAALNILLQDLASHPFKLEYISVIFGLVSCLSNYKGIQKFNDIPNYTNYTLADLKRILRNLE